MTKKKEPSTPRWKCPDCSAWIRDDVAEHTCAKAARPYYPWLQNGWTCSTCGAWVLPNCTHNCNYYWTYTTTTTDNTGGIGKYRIWYGNTAA